MTLNDILGTVSDVLGTGFLLYTIGAYITAMKHKVAAKVHYNSLPLEDAKKVGYPSDFQFFSDAISNPKVIYKCTIGTPQEGEVLPTFLKYQHAFEVACDENPTPVMLDNKRIFEKSYSMGVLRNLFKAQYGKNKGVTLAQNAMAHEYKVNTLAEIERLKKERSRLQEGLYNKKQLRNTVKKQMRELMTPYDER